MTFKLLEQNLTLDIDFSNETILGRTEFLLLLSLPSNSPKTLTLELIGLQFSLLDITISSTPFLELLSYQSPSLEKQASYLASLLPEPLSFDFYVTSFTKLEAQKCRLTEKITVFLQIKGDKPEEVKFSLTVLYKVVKPVSGLIFVKNLREDYNKKGSLTYNENHHDNPKINRTINNNDKSLYFNDASNQNDNFYNRVPNNNNPTHNNEHFLYSQNHHKSSRSWLPCLLEEEPYINTFTIIVPKGYLPLASGQVSQIVQQEDGLKQAFVYQLEKKLPMEKIGLCVGQFTYIQKENDFFVFASKNKDKESLKETMKVYEEILAFIESFKKDFFMNSCYKFVYLPQINASFSENQVPLSFSGMSLCDEGFLIETINRETYLRNKRWIFQLINWSMVNEIKLQSDLQDKWILYGFNGFLSDQFRGTNENEQRIYLAEVFNSFNKAVSKGLEVFPISCDQQTRSLSDHEFDELVRLKSRLVFHMITSISNCKKQIAKILFSKQSLNTEYFLKTIKINFGIKKLKYFVKQFVKSTGIPFLEVSYNYSRKEKKIFFTFNQKPLQENFYQSKQTARARLEEMKFGKACDELLILEKENKLGVPDISKSWRYFYGRLHVIVCETNEIDYKEESHQIFLDRKPESKSMINCRAQFRKTVNKKIGDNDDELGAGTSIMDYGYNAASSLYESKKRMSIFTFGNSARNPMLWIKLDCENEFFHEIAIKYESEGVLLMQLIKEKDAGAIYSLLKALTRFPNLTTVNTLCSLLETKDSDINIKLLIIKCLLALSSGGTGWRSLDMLMNILRKNCLETDGSLKPNNFSKYEDYLINKTIIHGIAKLKDEKSENEHYMSISTFNFLLKLLQENDNSKNEFSDSIYKGEIVRAILQSNNPKCCYDVLGEVYHVLEEEVANPSEKYQVIKIVLRYFGGFLEENHLDEKSMKKTQILGLSKELIYERIEKIMKKLKFLRRYALVEYFGFKLKFTEKFLMFHSWEVLTYALKKLEKYRTGKSFLLSVFEGMLMALVRYIEKAGEKFVMNLQKTLSLYNNHQVAGLIWEQMTSGFSMISPKIRGLWLRLYRSFYFHYFPLTQKPASSQSPELFFSNMFTINPSWLIEVITKKNEEQMKSKNILNLNYLSINKRKRVTLEKSKLNPKDTLITALTKMSADNEISWKSLARCILTILMGEKLTENIEKKFLNEEIDNTQINENAGEFNFVIKIKSPLTLKLIKKKLIKGMYENLEEIQEDVNEVIENYKKNDLIQTEIANEYNLLIERLFQEAQKILVEVREKDFRLENYNQNKIKLPKIKLTFDGKEMKFNNVGRGDLKQNFDL